MNKSPSIPIFSNWKRHFGLILSGSYRISFPCMNLLYFLKYFVHWCWIILIILVLIIWKSQLILNGYALACNRNLSKNMKPSIVNSGYESLSHRSNLHSYFPFQNSLVLPQTFLWKLKLAMDPLFLAYSYFRRKKYEQCTEICTQLLEKNPYDQVY